MTPPFQPPLGLLLTRTSRTVSRAFDDQLADAGGSLPIWLILLSLKTRSMVSQTQLAEAVGIRDATLSHHLDGMQSAGLVVRRRDPASRRTTRVEMTEAGEEMFLQLRTAALAYNQRLRTGLSDEDLTRLTDMLALLAVNASA